MKVSNPDDARTAVVASINDEWYTIEPGKSIEVSDPNVAMQLAQYGATFGKADYEKALYEAAALARGENSKTASAVASTDNVIGRQQQQTVDVSTGAVTDPLHETVIAHGSDPVKPDEATEPLDVATLQGDALKQALTERGLVQTGSADEKRQRIAEYEAAKAEAADGSPAGDSTPPAGDGDPR